MNESTSTPTTTLDPNEKVLFLVRYLDRVYPTAGNYEIVERNPALSVEDQMILTMAKIAMTPHDKIKGTLYLNWYITGEALRVYQNGHNGRWAEIEYKTREYVDKQIAFIESKIR